MANNLIQIKRSLTTAVPGSLANGELAYTANGDVLYIGSNGAVVAIGGRRVPGTLTANQALVSNSTSGIDKVIVANLVPTNVWANGAAGVAGQVLSSNSSGGVYWATPTSSVAGSDTQVQFNDGGSLAGDSGLTYNKTTDTLSTNTVLATSTVNAATLSVGGWVIANQSGVFTSGGVNGDILSVGTKFIANTTRVAIANDVGLSANGSTGSAGQVLTSNGTTVYWTTPATGDITAVTAGNGLTGGGTAGDVTLDVAAGNGISVSADAVAVSVGASGGLVSNTSGLFVQAANGITLTAAGVNVLANAGLVSNATGVHINTSGDTTLIANSLGLFVNDASLSIASSQITGDIALGGGTSGNYVATITAGAGISGSSTSEGGTPTIAVVANNGIVSNSSGVFAAAANGISVTTAGINVLAGTDGGLVSNSTGVFVTAGSGLLTNATGLHVGTGNGTAVDADSIRVVAGTGGGLVSNSTGVFVTAGSGLVTNATGVHVGSGNGISVSADALAVSGGSTLTVNSTGVHVNSALSLSSLATTGDLTVNGNTKLGDTSADVVSFIGYVNTSILPSANVTYDLGTEPLSWSNVHANNIHAQFGFFDKDVTVAGNLSVTGSLVTINVATLSVTDSLIQLATNNTSTDTIDIGFFGNYNTGSGPHEHTGLFRDATDGLYKLFEGLQEAPTTTVDTSNNTFSISRLQTFLVSGGLTTNSTSANLIANSTYTVGIVANTLTLASPLVGTSGGTGLNSYTAEDILVANSTNGFRRLALGTTGFVLQSNGSALVYDTLDGGTF